MKRSVGRSTAEPVVDEVHDGVSLAIDDAESRFKIGCFSSESRLHRSKSSDDQDAVPFAQLFNVGSMKSASEQMSRSSLPEIGTFSPDLSVHRTSIGDRQSHQVGSITGDDGSEISPIDDQTQCSDDSFVATKGARDCKLNEKRFYRRLVQKNGKCNVAGVGISGRRRMYISDIFTTLVEMPWSYHVAFFTTQFMVTWVLFGTIYYVIADGRGDIENAQNKTWSACVVNIYDFSSAVMFSMVTQTTIGYGDRYPNSACKVGMFVVMAQSCIGTFIQLFATGIVFTKISRPKGRAKTLMFSRYAVICIRDGQYQLMFRVGDMRHKSNLIGTSIRALLVRNLVTTDGQLIPMCQYPLALDNEKSSIVDSFLFMVWPVTIVNNIDESSPLWDISAQQLTREQFEIIVILEGTVESTGSSTQARTSYLPSEIYWGHRLAPLMTYHMGNGCYTVDYRRFHITSRVAMPDFSAKHWSTCQATSTTKHLFISGEYLADFTHGTVESVPQPQRFTETIFRHQSVNAAGFQQRIRKLWTNSNDELDPGVDWTQMKSSKPANALTRHLSHLWRKFENRNQQ